MGLTDSDVAHLVSQHGKHVKLEPCGRKWKVRSGSYVGLIRLPSGQEIAVRPKVRVANLLYIISYTHNLVDFKYLDKKQVDKNDSLLEICPIVLLKVYPHFLSPGKNQRSLVIIRNDYKNA
jgi:hypothetical protein